MYHEIGGEMRITSDEQDKLAYCAWAIGCGLDIRLDCHKHAVVALDSEQCIIPEINGDDLSHKGLHDCHGDI